MQLSITYIRQSLARWILTQHWLLPDGEGPILPILTDLPHFKVTQPDLTWITCTLLYILNAPCTVSRANWELTVYPTGSPHCHPPSGWQSMPVFLSSQQPASRITQTWCPEPVAAPCWSWWCWKWEGKGSRCLLLWLSLVRLPNAFYCGTHLSSHPILPTVELTCQATPCFQ